MRKVALGAALALLVATSAAAYTPSRSAARGEKATGDFERMLRKLDGRQKKLDSELATIGPKMDMVQIRMVARGRAYYRLIRAGLLPIGGGFDALVDHAAAVERLRAALGRDLELKRQLETRKQSVEAELKQLNAQRGPLMIQADAMHRASSVMRQAEERRAAFDLAFGRSRQSDHLTVYGASGAVSSDPMAPFPEMKGRLSFPLSGRAEIQRDNEPNAEPQALRLVASRDTAVRAVYPGRVVFSGASHVGDAIIIDHGGNYFTVYGNLDHIEVKEGDDLRERSRVGWVLRYGNKRPTLYFEIRHGKRLLDAGPWLGL
jgi:murein hydrolase activator